MEPAGEHTLDRAFGVVPNVANLKQHVAMQFALNCQVESVCEPIFRLGSMRKSSVSYGLFVPGINGWPEAMLARPGIAQRFRRFRCESSCSVGAARAGACGTSGRMNWALALNVVAEPNTQCRNHDDANAVMRS